MLFEKQYNINELEANNCKVSVQKYGFFLCKTGEAEILLGSHTYNIRSNVLCIYTPSTFLHIISKSDDIDGVTMQGCIDEYYSVVSSIDVRDRLKMRNAPCVVVQQRDVDSITKLVDMVNEQERIIEEKTPHLKESLLNSIALKKLQYLKHLLCMQIFDSYFRNSPVLAQPVSHTDVIFNNFLISVYKNCRKHRTVQFYAAQQHLSPYYFSNIIRARSGRSVMTWIEELTMTLSMQMLECTSDSIKEIAEKLNFPDQSTFSRYFKRCAKVSPTEYRRKI